MTPVHSRIAIGGDGATLALAADVLRTERDFLLAALAANADAWSHLRPAISPDGEVELALALVQKNVHFHYKRLPGRVRGDPRVVVAALRGAGLTSLLEDASPATRNNKEIIMEAIKIWGGALKYASDDLKEDAEVVAAAVASDHGIFKDLPCGMKRNKDVVMAALKNARYPYMADQVWGEVADELRDDPEVVATRLVKDPTFLASNAGPNLKKRLKSAIYGLKNLTGEPAPRIVTAPGEVEECAGRMKRGALERIWLLRAACGDVLRDNRDVERRILEYANIPGLFRRADNVLHCAPLFVAWGTAGIGWKEMSTTKKRKR